MSRPMPARPDPEEQPDPVVPDTTAEGREREDLAGPGPAGGELIAPDGALLPDSDQPGSEEPGGTGSDPPRSGLRNPNAAVRGVGAGAMVIEAIVLLLAIVPLIKLGTGRTGPIVVAIVTLIVLCLIVAGLLRYRWAWWAGAAIQVLLFASGLLHVALAILGLVFGAVWAYVLSVRRSVLG
jgi:Protein of unknown function (DUF4233)